jgi:ankyrin repeat protein
MHIARINDNAYAIRFFISPGAKIDALDNSNCTPLFEFGGDKSTILLLAAGADVHARDERGRTPIIEVASFFMREFDDVRSVVNVMLAGGANLDDVDRDGNIARQLLAQHGLTFDVQAEEVQAARSEIAKARLDFVRYRALEVCIGLQSLQLDALQLCEILLHACGQVAPLIAFHQWWKIATTVNHFKTRVL